MLYQSKFLFVKQGTNLNRFELGLGWVKPDRFGAKLASKPIKA